MAQFSTGLGLAVLGSCILGAAALSSPRLGNSATAAGNPVGDVVAENHLASPAFTSTCDDAPVAWLSTSPRQFISGCYTFNTPDQPFVGVVDLNADGRPESLSCNAVPVLRYQQTYESPTFQVVSGSSLTTTLQFQPVTGGAQLRGKSICTADAAIGQYLRDSGAWNPIPWDGRTLWTIKAYITAWMDCDADGDLDAVVRFRAEGSNGSTYYFNSLTLWLENTGFQSNPYDLDHDGHVNNADLSLMLMEYTD